MGGHKCGRFKGVKMQRYNVRRFKGSEDAKVQCWEAYEQIEQATITAVRENISLWESVLVLKGHSYEQDTITENISLWEGVVVLKGQYI